MHQAVIRLSTFQVLSKADEFTVFILKDYWLGIYSYVQKKTYAVCNFKKNLINRTV